MENLISFSLILLFVIGISYLLHYFFLSISEAKSETKTNETEKRRQVLQTAQNNYLNELTKLKSNPNNPEIKQQALLKGREYSALTRKYQGLGKLVTIFDEVTLMNDISAACTSNSSIINSASNLQTSEERLANLLNLKTKNLISEEEYQVKKQKILEEI